MNSNNLLNRWISEELAMMRNEGATEVALFEPSTQAGVFVNVLASHVSEFLADKALVIALKRIFERRGLVGEAWFTTLFGLSLEMSPEQLPILSWLMEEKAIHANNLRVLWLSRELESQQVN